MLLQDNISVRINVCELCLLLSGIVSLLVSVITWNDLILAAKRSKYCTPNRFAKISVFFLFLSKSKLLLVLADVSVRIDSYELWFLCNDEVVLRSDSVYWNNLVLVAKKKKKEKEHPKPRLANFHFFFNYFTVDQIIFTCPGRLFCLNQLRKNFLYLEQSFISFKKFQRVSLELILPILRIFYSFYYRPNFYFY